MVAVFRDIKPEFVDARGGIARVLDDGKTAVRSVLLITSKKGSVRANHYHKKDSHYSYMLSGRMEYAEQRVGKDGVIDKNSSKEFVIVKAGDMVFTPPMTAHVMRFLEDSVFLALATESRLKATYEEDTVRVMLSA